MPKRIPKFVYSIVCDDIREEIGNKLSFMGVYGSDIFVPAFPFTFPLLCTAINYKNAKSGDTFSIKFKRPNGDIIGKEISGIVPGKDKNNITFSMLAKFAPLKIEKEGVHKIEILFNNDQKTKQIIEIAIKKRE
jgi:hypothetical protein